VRPASRNVLAGALALVVLGVVVWPRATPEPLPGQLFARHVGGSPTAFGLDVRVAPAGDVDGDGRGDVVVLERERPPRLLSGADGRELELAPTLPRRPDLRAAVGVGRGELVVSNGVGGVFVWGARGERRLTLDPPARGRVELHVLDDLDGDGVRELALVRHDLAPRRVELRSPHADRALLVAPQPRPFEDRELAWAEAVCSAGDVDGDGAPELAVGSPARIDGGHGMVELLSGRDGRCLAHALGGPRFGGSMCALDDLDGDGARELAVAGDDLVELRSGATLELLRAFGEDARAQGAWGPSVAPAGDVDGAGLGALLVTWTVHVGRGPLAAGSLAELLDPRDGRRLAAMWLPGIASRDFAVPAGDADGDGAADLAVLRALQARSPAAALWRLATGEEIRSGTALHVLSGRALAARGGTLDLGSDAR
jgi:hypothetical protein